MFVGTSLILRRVASPSHSPASLLYGVRAPRGERGRKVLEVTGIGGALESSDTSPGAGAVREALEETRCQVALLKCRETLVVHSASRLRRIELSGEERPAAVVFRHHDTPTRQPWSDQHRGRACIAVFAGELLGPPQPAMELPALIWLRPQQVVQIACRDMGLQDVLDQGARLVEGAASAMPRDAAVRLVDSQEALVLALGQNALTFYCGIFGDITA